MERWRSRNARGSRRGRRDCRRRMCVVGTIQSQYITFTLHGMCVVGTIPLQYVTLRVRYMTHVRRRHDRMSVRYVKFALHDMCGIGSIRAGSRRHAAASRVASPVLVCFSPASNRSILTPAFAPPPPASRVRTDRFFWRASGVWRGASSSHHAVEQGNVM